MARPLDPATGDFGTSTQTTAAMDEMALQALPQTSYNGSGDIECRVQQEKGRFIGHTANNSASM